jgi:fucose permease
METKTSVTKTFPVLFSFFIMGFCDLVGVSVTYAKEQFAWSEIEANFLPSMVFIWFLILSIPTAMIMSKIGRKNTVLASLLTTFIGMLIPVIRFDEIFCYIAFGFLGIGNTILQVSLNPLLTNAVKNDKLTSNLTAGQFIKSISSFLGPIVAGFCSLHFGSWNLLFPVYAGASLLSSLWLFFTPIDREKSVQKVSSFGETISLLKDKRILWLFLGILCIVGLDVGMNTVTPKILIERAGFTKEAAGYGSSWYFGARTIGTFLGAFFLAKFSGKSYFRVNMLIACLAIIVLFFVHSQIGILAMVCVIAFTSSSIFAVLFSMAIQALPEKANEISGLMITGVSGGALFPLLMGVAANITGNQSGSLFVIGLTAIYLLLCAYCLKISRG